MVAQIDRKFIQARPWKIWSRMVAYLLFEGRPLTTRGRWINPLVFAGHRLWAILPDNAAKIRPIFILGTGRSGTTVLGTILGLHRDVGYLNEPKALWQAALGDDDLIGSFSPNPGRYRMDAKDAQPAKVRKLRNSYRAFLKLSLSKRVVDKYPELIFRDGLLDAAFPQAHKIILLRNGTDIVQSIAKWSDQHRKTNGSDKSDWWGQDDRKWQSLVKQLVVTDPYFSAVHYVVSDLQDPADRAAVEWIVTMREAMRLKETRADWFLLVRYENLVTNPKKTLSEISDFCDLRPDKRMLAYGKNILNPRPGRPAPDLHPAIAPLFADTMNSLGYRS